jgi:hypothetical protein
LPSWSQGILHVSLFLCLSLCPFSSSKDISHTGLRACPIQYYTISTNVLIASSKNLFPRKFTLTGTRCLELQHIFWGETIQSRQLVYD